MDFDQTQAISDYEEEEEEKVEDDKANTKKKEAAHLKVFSQQGFKEAIFPIFKGDNIIGRDGKCNITVPIKALSKKHACIEVQRDLHLIYDCGSKNRTKKGKSFLKPTIRYELKHGDMLTLGDVKCQYVVGLDMEEEDEDETGSETGSESMLQDVNTEEESDIDKQPVITDGASTSKKMDENGSIPRSVLVQQTEDHQITKPTKDDEVAYAADTDSDTDEERPVAVAAMATVLYSSEDEQETPRRPQVSSVPSKVNSSMEGQTLAFGLGSPDHVFQSRDSTGSSGSHPGQTASIPPMLMLTTESDSQSDGKLDVSSDLDHKPSSFKRPGPRSSGTQPPCEPTLLYGSESDDSSPRKRPGHPEARIPGKGPSCDPTLLYGSESDDGSPIKRPKHPEAGVFDKGPSCKPTLLYGSESDDGSPIKRPKHPEPGVLDKGPSCEPTLLYGSESDDGTPKKRSKQPVASNKMLYESDAEEDTTAVVAPIEMDTRGDGHHASDEQTLLYIDISEEKVPSLSDKSSGNMAENRTDRPDIQLQATEIKDADETLPYAEAEMSSTDDEDESGADANDKEINLEDTLAHAEPTLAYNAEETGKEDSTDDEHENLDAGDYGADIATQAYVVDNIESESETESEPIPLVESGHTAADKSGANQAANPSDFEATQAYCLEDKDSNSSDSQPLPIGTAAATHDDISATMAYGVEATQAYNVSENDNDNSEDEGEQNKKQMPAYDLQATQAYGTGDDDDDDTRDSHSETVEKQSASMGNEGDTGQPTIPYGLEATQAYGVDEETSDEDVDNEDRSSTGGDQGRGDANAATLPYGLAPTQPYGGDDVNDDSDGDGDNKVDKDSGNVRQDNLATLPYRLEETQAYDGDNINNDTDAAQNSMVEATQAYGIEEPAEAELQEQQSKGGTKQTKVKRVALACTSTEVPEVDETEFEVDASAAGGEGKPSTSTAADVEEYLLDSEDLIPQPQSRSKRERKKQAIKESQEGASQKLDKFGEAGNHTLPVAASSSVFTTEQIEEASDTSEGILKRNNKIAPRKGRRGVMSVTIEPEEPEGEATSENSTRRGRRGVMMVTNETDDQEEDIPKGTPAAGRKRGRLTTKTTGALLEEDKEMPVTKSRRGRKGNQLQADTTSVSETPLKTPSDTARVQEVIDSEPATVVVKEPLSVRRGGRGRGRKGVTAKETVQTMEDQGEEASGISVEPQPESHVEPVSTRGKGKGKGRGKKSQPSNNEPMATESVDTALSAISEDVKPQHAIATPVRGRGRGKGRGKKAQPTPSADQDQDQLGASSRSSSPYSVPETPAINDEELPPPESPVIAASSKGKGRGRQGRGKKTQHSVAELEAEEKTPELESESSQRRKGRSKGKIARESTEQNSDIVVTLSESTEFSETIGDSEESSTAGSSKGSRRGRQRKEVVEDSESAEVEETPVKKSRRGKEPAVVRSPSLNRGKSPGESKPRIMFTGLVDKQGEKVVTNLGGQLVDNIHNCTHLVTDKVRRTVKFLCGLASGQVIVLPSWLDACKKAKSFVDPSPFFVKDKDAEKQYKFTLQRSHDVALTKGLLEGYKIHVTKKVKPEPSQMKDIIQSAKGEFLSSVPRSKDDRIFVISCEEDKSVCKKPLEAGIPVVSAEVLLTGVLRQELDLEEHKLFADQMSNASQNTTSSDGQSKRRRETETGTSSSSTPEPKSTGSKRRR